MTVPHRAFFADIEGTFDPVWSALGGDREVCIVPAAVQRAGGRYSEAVIRTGDVDVVVVDR